MSGVLAAGLTLLFYSSSFRPILPFLFLVPIIAVALRFGNIAGVLGTVVAALIFASLLFEPRLNLSVSNLAARNNLIWMVIVGLAISGLLGRNNGNLRTP